jgi:protein-tyrosine phosphatase
VTGLAVQMVAAYLMVVDGMSAEEAVASIRLKRRVVQPNDGFLQQLVAWQVPPPLPSARPCFM